MTTLLKKLQKFTNITLHSRFECLRTCSVICYVISYFYSIGCRIVNLVTAIGCVHIAESVGSRRELVANWCTHCRRDANASAVCIGLKVLLRAILHDRSKVKPEANLIDSNTLNQTADIRTEMCLLKWSGGLWVKHVMNFKIFGHTGNGYILPSTIIYNHNHCEDSDYFRTKSLLQNADSTIPQSVWFSDSMLSYILYIVCVCGY